MKIENNPPSQSLEKSNASLEPGAAEPRPADLAANPTTPDSAGVSGLAAAIRSSTENRVEALKQAYEQGRYQADPAKVAAKLVDSHQPE